MLCCAVPSRRLAALSSRPIQQRYRPLLRLAMHPTGSPLATSGIAQDPPRRRGGSPWANCRSSPAVVAAVVEVPEPGVVPTLGEMPGVPLPVHRLAPPPVPAPVVARQRRGHAGKRDLRGGGGCGRGGRRGGDGHTGTADQGQCQRAGDCESSDHGGSVTREGVVRVELCTIRTLRRSPLTTV